MRLILLVRIILSKAADPLLLSTGYWLLATDYLCFIFLWLLDDEDRAGGVAHDRFGG
jgi:hypothetical protein